MHVEARQGDVALLFLGKSMDDKELEGAVVADRDGNDVILAYGEVTGHAHRINDENAVKYEIRLAEGIEEYLSVVEGGGPASLTHDEHAMLTIPEGVYAILHQVEHSPGDIPVYVRD